MGHAIVRPRAVVIHFRYASNDPEYVKIHARCLIKFPFLPFTNLAMMRSWRLMSLTLFAPFPMITGCLIERCHLHRARICETSSQVGDPNAANENVEDDRLNGLKCMRRNGLEENLGAVSKETNQACYSQNGQTIK